MPSLALAQLQQVDHGTGTEWLIIASVLVPIFLLVLIFWYGHRNTV
jgi:hypothetical protein